MKIKNMFNVNKYTVENKMMLCITWPLEMSMYQNICKVEYNDSYRLMNMYTLTQK